MIWNIMITEELSTFYIWTSMRIWNFRDTCECCNISHWYRFTSGIQWVSYLICCDHCCIAWSLASYWFWHSFFLFLQKIIDGSHSLLRLYVLYAHLLSIFTTLRHFANNVCRRKVLSKIVQVSEFRCAHALSYSRRWP